MLSISPIRYSKKELKEFEVLLNRKLKQTQKNLSYLKNSILRTASGYDSNHTAAKFIEDSSRVLEKEELNKLAARMLRFKQQIEDALIRVKNGTYGVCIETGKLISKKRLRIVPHTQYAYSTKIKKIDL